MDLPAAPRRRSRWLVPALVVAIGILVILTGVATRAWLDTRSDLRKLEAAWLDTRSDLRKLEAASRSLARVDASTVDALRKQVITLQKDNVRLLLKLKLRARCCTMLHGP